MAYLHESRRDLSCKEWNILQIVSRLDFYRCLLINVLGDAKINEIDLNASVGNLVT